MADLRQHSDQSWETARNLTVAPQTHVSDPNVVRNPQSTQVHIQIWIWSSHSKSDLDCMTNLWKEVKSNGSSRSHRWSVFTCRLKSKYEFRLKFEFQIAAGKEVEGHVTESDPQKNSHGRTSFALFTKAVYCSQPFSKQPSCFFREAPFSVSTTSCSDLVCSTWFHTWVGC